MNSPANSPVVLLIVYCALAFLAAFGGGKLPLLAPLTHPRLQVAVSFVAGFMLGLALLGLLPHAIHELGSVQLGTAWLLAGFLVMFLMQRFLPFHYHDVLVGHPEPIPAQGRRWLHGRRVISLGWAWRWVCCFTSYTLCNRLPSSFERRRI